MRNGASGHISISSPKAKKLGTNNQYGRDRMGYPDDLLQYAKQMAEQYPNEAHQPSLRRALSSAYYALFHLLICDAVANCTDPRFRAVLARMFDHGRMKNVCENSVERIKNLFHPDPPGEPERTIQ